MDKFLLKRKNIAPALLVSIVFAYGWASLFNTGLPAWTSSWNDVDTLTCPVETSVTENGVRANVTCTDVLTTSYNGGDILERILYRGTEELTCTVVQNSNSGEQRLRCSIPT